MIVLSADDLYSYFSLDLLNIFVFLELVAKLSLIDFRNFCDRWRVVQFNVDNHCSVVGFLYRRYVPFIFT